MSYRVETASTGRAGCQSVECKKHKIKIDKDELRFGVWVDYGDRQGWGWRHWGCMSGKQLENLRNNLEDPDSPGSYLWDHLDGYDGDEKNSLSKHPDLQEKVRRVIVQGSIDSEDFNGDPEMNKLGESGLFTKETKKRQREEEKARIHEINDLKETVARLEAEKEALRQEGGSTARLSAEIGDVEENIKGQEEPKAPVSVKRVKPEVDSDEEKKPPKKKRAIKTKVKKQENDEEEEAAVAKRPARKTRAKRVKKEESDDEIAESSEPEPTPAKKARAKKRVKKEEAELVKNEDDFDSPAIIEAPKKRAARGEKPIKKETADEAGEETAEEVPKRARAKREQKKSVKNEPSWEAENEMSSVPTSQVKEEPFEAQDGMDEIAAPAPVVPKRRVSGRSRAASKN